MQAASPFLRYYKYTWLFLLFNYCFIKQKNKNMKKIILLTIIILGLHQGYGQMIVLDSVRGGMHIPYCEHVDQITLIAPDGATDVLWTTNYQSKKEGNNLIIYDVHPINKYGDEVLCTYTKEKVKGEKKYITLHMISPPKIPTFKDCILDNGMITLDASSIELNVWGFTKYLWSTGSTDKLITVSSPGIYTVTISNICGVITYSVTVSADNKPAIKKPKPFTKKKLRDPDDVKKSGLTHWWLVWKYEHLW